jgi:ABC-2 type transport system permease protein
VPVSVAFLALYYAAVGVALAATTSRRVVGAVAVLALLLVTSTIAGIATGVANEGASGWALVNVLAVPLHVRDLVFLGHTDPDGPLGGIAGGGFGVVAVYAVVLAASLGYLLRRYREVHV